jgi:hypothetical protein
MGHQDHSWRDDHADQNSPLTVTFSETGRKQQDDIVSAEFVVDLDAVADLGISKIDLDGADVDNAKEVLDMLMVWVDYFGEQMPRRRRTAEVVHESGD